VLANFTLKRETVAGFRLENFFSFIEKYYKISPDLRLDPCFFFFTKLFQISQAIENLVAHLTIGQHCC